jgi:hypothetical protein
MVLQAVQVLMDHQDLLVRLVLPVHQVQAVHLVRQVLPALLVLQEWMVHQAVPVLLVHQVHLD